MPASEVSQCTVCRLNPDDLALVNDDLDGGVSLRKLEARYGLSRSALSRHRRFHLPVDIESEDEQIRDEADRAKIYRPMLEDHTPQEWATLLRKRTEHYLDAYRTNEPARERARRFLSVAAIVAPTIAVPLGGLTYVIQHAEPYQPSPLHPPTHATEEERRHQLELQTETMNTLKEANTEEVAL